MRFAVDLRLSLCRGACSFIPALGLGPQMRTLVTAVVVWCTACSPMYTRTSGPVDRGDLPLHITRVRGHVYVVEDYSYWKTNSVLYAHPDGIVFVDATWSDRTARQM